MKLNTQYSYSFTNRNQTNQFRNYNNNNNNNLYYSRKYKKECITVLQVLPVDFVEGLPSRQMCLTMVILYIYLF